MTTEQRTCALTGCVVEFQPKTANQKHCCPEHGRRAANLRRTNHDMPAVSDDYEVTELRQQLKRLYVKLQVTKAREEGLVQATIESARDAALSLGPIGPTERPATDLRRKDAEVALWHLTDWQGAKALDDDTPMLTTEGWKRHGDIVPGDFVYGPDGKPKKVLGVTGSREVECFQVAFDGGVSIVASGDHLWQGWRRYKNGAGPYEGYTRRPLTWTTSQIAELKPTIRDTRQYVERAFHVDLPKPLELPDTGPLPIEPHLLGCWLGDGAADKGEMTMTYDDAAALFPAGYINFYPSRPGLPYIRIPGLRLVLKELGVLNNKHIPDSYLYASPEDRMCLVQGLMDTDGTVDEEGTCSFTNTNKALIDGLVFLLASLGVKAVVRQGIGKFNGVPKKPMWIVVFSAHFPVFCLRRKAMKQRLMGPQNRYRFVQSVTPVGLRSAQCLTVEGDLYLAGRELVLTHNCTTSYNSEVMAERVIRFCHKAESITKIQRADHPVRRCYILFGGDMGEGLFNFPTQAFEIDATIFGQYVSVSKLIVQTVQFALRVYDHVTVVAEWGNHGRIGSKRDAVPRSDNFDRMIYELSRQLLAGESRLTWEDCPEDIQRVEIGAYRALLIHGDEVGRGGFASRNTMIGHGNRWKAGAYPWSFRDIYIGHYHVHAQEPLADGLGSLYWTGSTESDNRYARDMLAASASPSQRLHFIDKERGRVSAIYQIWLEE